MNDLPQNELLSAYLDGELTAAEQAEVERLLAADPAARQLLDELRALSAAVQSLPQQKLGEDLSRQVLLVAERRMLTEGEPGDAAPVPLSRTIFQRFVNRRTIVWTSLIVVIAVMIVVNEHQQQTRLADKKEVAMARAEHKDLSEKSPSEVRSVPTIEATRESEVTADKATRHPAVEEKSEPASELAKAPADLPAMKTAVKKGTMEPPVITNDFAASPPLESKPLGGSATLDHLYAPSKAAAAAPPNSMARRDRTSGKVAAGYGMKRQEIAKQAEKPVSDVLVVFCDISPEAVEKKAFDKLLGANGITWRRQPVRKDGDSADHSELVNFGNAGVPAAAEKAGQTPAIPLSNEERLRRTIAAGNAELVYVEATPAQVRATLAGFEAQPNVFLSFSVQPAQDEATRWVVRYFVEGDRESRSNSAGGQRLSDSEDRRENRQLASKPAAARSAKPEDAAKSNAVASDGSSSANTAPPVNTTPSTNAAPSANAAPSVVSKNGPGFQTPGSSSAPSRGSQSQSGAANQQSVPSQSAIDLQQEAQVQQQAARQPAPRQRVLFVLRVSGRPLPEASETGGQSGDRAKQSPAPGNATPAPSK